MSEEPRTVLSEGQSKSGQDQASRASALSLLIETAGDSMCVSLSLSPAVRCDSGKSPADHTNPPPLLLFSDIHLFHYPVISPCTTHQIPLDIHA